MSRRDMQQDPAAGRIRRPFRACARPKDNGGAISVDAAEQEREAARRAGYEEGLAEGRRAAEAAVATFRGALEEKLAELAALSDALRRKYEEDLLALVAMGVEKIVRERVEAGDPVVRRALDEALSRLAGAETVTVRAHPEEADALKDVLAQRLPGADGRVIADPAISRGGCRVDSDLGSVDATLEASLAALDEVLGVARRAEGDGDGREDSGGAAQAPPEPDDPA